MKTLYFISRNFVEFGPLAGEEIVDLRNRDVLRDDDYVRDQNTQQWEPMTQWAMNGGPVKNSSKKKAATTGKKKESVRKQ